MTDKATDYRATLNLMDTPFPMRGDLPKREPAWAQAWNEQGLYKNSALPATAHRCLCCTTALLMPTASCTLATH